MSPFADLTRSASAGFQAGSQAGAPNAFGLFIKNVLSGRQKQQERKQDTQQKVTETFLTEGIKAKFKGPQPWKPTTQEEAFEFEKAKRNLYPEGYREDLQITLDAVNKTTNQDTITKLYQRLASKYPKQSAELKRILIPSSGDAFFNAISNLYPHQGL